MKRSLFKNFSIFLGLLVAAVLLIGLFIFFTREETTSIEDKVEVKSEALTFNDPRYSINFRYPSNCVLSNVDEIEESAPESIRSKYDLDMLLAAECKVNGSDLRLSVEKYQFEEAENPEVMFNKLLIDSAQEGMNIQETGRQVDEGKVTIEYENSFLFTKYLSKDVFYVVNSEGYLFSFSAKKGDWEDILETVNEVENSISSVE